ncbi:MAG: UvrD-helicase domain-containing protein [Chloroflexi bacterium]|nr:UvrD-helicase domain-containing protein [Chloroflexota bacterium]
MTDLASPVTADLTPAQRRIVEWGDGPLVVIAGAGTGKTRVIVERVRWLLETKAEAATTPSGGLVLREPAEAGIGDDPFAGPLQPEQILVLTYNVKAAKELADRIEAAIGPAARARLPVSNFHSFCHRLLIESAADAGLPAQPDVLDGIGQVLLLRDIRPNLPLLYYAGGSNPNYWLDQFVAFVNRAKDELVTPDDFDTFVEREREAFENRYGNYDKALGRLQAQGNLAPLREVRKAYADLRRAERAEEAGDVSVVRDLTAVEKVADREARRSVSGDGRALSRNQFAPADLPRIDALTDTYVADGAALEILRLSELALVYHAYQDMLAERGALDFGEQISLVTRLFKQKPNVLRRYQRQYRYLLVDEFQDANIAQIELIEFLGRTPDRPDNVMVVGDDDQSIYRFRGASYAAFVEFDGRFSGPPAHDPGGRVPGAPPRLRIEESFRSVEPILSVANRLIAHNQLRYEPDKRLAPTRGLGDPVELVVATDVDDEARQIVDRIKAWTGWDSSIPDAAQPTWSEYAVLYRKHRHREAIVARLREEAIPYTVVGGLSLFETAEIRDLEQSLRAIADPLQDVALVRMMSAGPWRLDSLEILQIARMAKYDNRHLIDVIHEVVESGQLEVDRVRATDEEAAPDAAVTTLADGEEPGAGGLALQPAPIDLTAPAEAKTAPPPPRETRRIHLAPATRAKLRRLLGTLDELAARTWRDGPFTVLEEYVIKTGMVFDLIALDTLEAKRTVANIANFMRFTHDWQAEHPLGTLAGFVDYLDAYQSAGGELPTSVEASDDLKGVRLMTLYQAKGLEFGHVFVPQLLKDEWPAREYGSGLFPKELLKEAVPTGDIHTEEERRLLYVALTRARDRLVVTTIAGPAAEKDPSPFLADLRDGAGGDLAVVDRAAGLPAQFVRETDDGQLAGAEDEPAAQAASEEVARVLPPPTAREHRLALRVRAGEVLQLLEGVSPNDPESDAARRDLTAQFAGLAERAVESADEARAHRLDPLTLRVLALDSGAGASLLEVAALPATFSYSQIDAYERCPLQHAFRHVFRIPSSQMVGALTFGSTAHAAFDAFTRERRERLARGEPPPTRADLDRLFEAEWKPGDFEEKTAEKNYRQRVNTLLSNFWEGELASIGTAETEELPFELALEMPDGEPAIFTGIIDRIDRLPSGGIEVIDYKTGRLTSQKSVQESLQLSIYALACRDALGLGTPEKVTLYFTESATRMSTTRTNEQLDQARDELVAWVTRVRSGDFAATPSASVCWRCEYAPMCPSRTR